MSPKDIFSIFIHEKQASMSISEVTENPALLHLQLHFKSQQKTRSPAFLGLGY